MVQDGGSGRRGSVAGTSNGKVGSVSDGSSSIGRGIGAQAQPSLGVRLRRALDRASLYLPVLLMGLFALGSWWLVRNTPDTATPRAAQPLRHEPDYFMRDFSVRTFDAGGRLQSEVFGAYGQHFPDTDTLEVDRVRVRSFDAQGRLTTATAERAISKGDATEVQLIGDAVVVREAVASAPRLEFRGDFLHAFLQTEQVRSHKPVTLLRGADRFTAESLDFDNLARVLQLRGRVRGVIEPGGGSAGGSAPATVPQPAITAPGVAGPSQRPTPQQAAASPESSQPQQLPRP